MLSPYVTFKVIYRSPGTRKIFSIGQDQILYIICGQRLFRTIFLYLSIRNRLCTFNLNGMPLIHLCRILEINAVPVAVIYRFINRSKSRHIPVAVTVALYFLPCASVHNGNIITVSRSVRCKGNGIIKPRLCPALKTGIYLRFMAVNIPHGFQVNVIIFHFIPVRLMVIVKKVLPIYRRIEEIAVLHGIANDIYVIPGIPFIHLYAFLPVNGNRFAGLQILLHCRRIDIMSRSFFLRLFSFIPALLLHGLEYHIIIGDHINQIGVIVYVLLRQLPVDKKSAMLRIRYQKPVLRRCHKAVAHSLPAIRILVGIKSYRRFRKIL
ncbi:hypothetical protein IMSAGC002_04464 [Lachnospiraceae bacterium]|nr:hypothetical protein IMSAGC002_04464 [Lachnospiraceae bacterium]